MKKVSKIAAIALALVFVLVGCSNPNGGDGLPEIESISVSDIKKPGSYNPVSRQVVKTEADAMQVYKNLNQEFQNLMTAPAADMGMTFGSDQKNKEEQNKLLQTMFLIGMKKQQEIEYDESCSLSFAPGFYEKTFGSYKNLYFNMTLREKFEKYANKITNVNVINMNCTVDIKDTHLMETSLRKSNEQLPPNLQKEIPDFKYIKAAKYGIKSNTSTTIVSEGGNQQQPIPNGNNEMKGALLFDDGTYNGIVEFDIKGDSEGTKNTAEIKATFYDINGKNPHGPFTIRQ